MASPQLQSELHAAACKRQKDYVDRLKEKGYVILSGLYVPAAIRAECRELVKKRVAKFEKEQLKF